jgi:hypothetical protein
MHAFTLFRYRVIICFVLPLTLTISLTGCYKEVDDLQLLQGPKLVVYSVISPQDTVLTVRITQSTPLFESAQTGGAVTNASVRLSDGITSVELAHRTKGIYTVTASRLAILPDRTYFLTVTTPEGLRAEATCKVPKRANDAITQVQLDPIQEELITGFFLSVEWQDAPGEGDHYRIFAKSPTLLRYTRQGPDQPDQIDTLHPRPIHFQQGEIYTQDAGKDGQKYRVAQGSFIAGSSINSKGQYIQLFERKFRLVLLTTDRAYYQYHQSLQRYEAANSDGNPDDPFAEPTLVFSNVEGGLGVFAAYQKYEREVTF